jgi:hypothetical protein
MVSSHRDFDASGGPIPSYGTYLLQLGESHGLLLLTGIPQYLDLCSFTCSIDNGDASVVDCLGSMNLLPHIPHLFISPSPSHESCIHHLLPS